MEFLKKNAIWLASAIVLTVATVLIVIALVKPKDDKVTNKTDSGINMIEDDGVKPLEIGLEFGNTKYEGGLEDFGYTGAGVTIWEAIRSEENNLFFATDGNEADTIKRRNEMLMSWEEGGVYVNGYKETAPLIKYGEKAYYVYFAYDKNATVKPVKGMTVSIQGTLVDGQGGKAIFHPVTFEYKGNEKWEIVSRKKITPQEKPAQHATIKITGVDPERTDKNLFFLVEDGCVIRTMNSTISSWTDGGVYLNGKQVWAPLVKHSGTGYYVYFGMDNFATVNPVKGTKISIQGTLSDGKNTTTFEPATFEFDGNGKWKLTSRDKVNQTSADRPEPKEGEKTVYLYETTRQDSNLFFESSSNDKLTYSTDTWNCKAWGTSEKDGLFVNNVKQDVPIIKHAENGYLVYWKDYGITPTKGTKVTIQGKFKMGDETITFHPATFEYDGLNWNLVSRKEITPEKEKPGEVVKVTLNWNSAREDKNLFFTTDKTDAIKTMNTAIYTWTEGGVYMDGKKIHVHLIKHDATGYYVYFGWDKYATANPVKGTRISIQGILTDNVNSVEFAPITFEFDGKGTWKVVSREKIK